MKETEAQSFDLHPPPRSRESVNILHKLRLTRKQLLSSLTSKDPNKPRDLLLDYILYTRGFTIPQSPLSHLFSFKWTTPFSKTLSTLNGCSFEVPNMCQNVALFYLNLAQSSLKGIDPSNTSFEGTVKQSFNHLKTSAGILSLSMDVGDTSELSDMFYNQVMGEAQEIVVERAIRMKHDNSLVAKLAHVTSQFYKRCYDISSLLTSGELIKYYDWKHRLFLALAFSFHTIELLALEKAADAKCANWKAQTHFEEAVKLARVKEWQRFTMGFHNIVKRHGDRCDMESKMIYSTVPKSSDIPPPAQPDVGRVEADKMNVPDVSSVWTQSAYDGFSSG